MRRETPPAEGPFIKLDPITEGHISSKIDHVLDESLEQVELATAGMAFETAVTEFPVQACSTDGVELQLQWR
jgi:hypothetical protein